MHHMMVILVTVRVKRTVALTIPVPIYSCIFKDKMQLDKQVVLKYNLQALFENIIIHVVAILELKPGLHVVGWLGATAARIAQLCKIQNIGIGTCAFKMAVV